MEDVTDTLVKEPFQFDDREEVFRSHSGLQFLTDTPEVLHLNIKSQGKKVRISFTSSDGYSLYYSLRPALDDDFNGNVDYIHYFRSRSLIAESMHIEKDGKSVDILKQIKDSDPEDIPPIVAINTQSDKLQTIPDKFKGQDKLSYLRRNVYLYSTSESENSAGERRIFMPLPINDFGLVTFFHEVGHLYTEPSLDQEHERLVIEEGIDVNDIYDADKAQGILEKLGKISQVIETKKERQAHSVGLELYRKIRKSLDLGSEKNKDLIEIANLTLFSYEANKNKPQISYDQILDEAA